MHGVLNLSLHHRYFSPRSKSSVSRSAVRLLISDFSCSKIQVIQESVQLLDQFDLIVHFAKSTKTNGTTKPRGQSQMLRPILLLLVGEEANS